MVDTAHVDHARHHISDVTKITEPLAMQEVIRHSRENNHLNEGFSGWAITAGKTDFVIKMGMKLTQSVTGIKLKQFETLQDTLDFLREEDPDLEWATLNQSALDVTY